MSQFPNQYGTNSSSNSFGLDDVGNPAVTRFFNSVYSWMCAGLALTALVAWFAAQYIAANPATMRHAGLIFIGLFIVQILLVGVIGNAINSINSTQATGLFLLYCALSGVSLSGMFLIYTQSTLASAFVVTAGTFGAMSVYGMVTKRDLNSMGRILYMALIGLIIASIVSIFWHDSMLQVAINYAGVLIFVGLTAYDTQKLKSLAYQTEHVPALAARLAIVGSLMLYLDFINMFIFIVRIMGDRRR